jgi:hypothetical protein
VHLVAAHTHGASTQDEVFPVYRQPNLGHRCGSVINIDPCRISDPDRVNGARGRGWAGRKRHQDGNTKHVRAMLWPAQPARLHTLERATVRCLPTFAKVLLASLVHVRVVGLQRTSPHSQSSGVRAALAPDPRFEAQPGGSQASTCARRAVRRRKRAQALCGPAAHPGPLARPTARGWKRPSPCAAVQDSLSLTTRAQTCGFAASGDHKVVA